MGENAKRFKDRAYTTQLLPKADEKMGVVILLLASTGMRIGAIPDLKLKHLTKIEQFSLYQITVYENTKDEYYCFALQSVLLLSTHTQHTEKDVEKIGPDSSNKRIIQ